MPAVAIISYDGTPNDDDGLALGGLLAQAGADLALAYVRHSREFDPRREEIAQHDAERRLEHGRAGLEDIDATQHVVISASTSDGLARLAGELGSPLIVFGSDYRTTPGHVEPGATAQNLLEGGTVAVAVAPAGLRAATGAGLARIATFDGDGEVADTAKALAELANGELVGFADQPDLVVVGSHAGAPDGRIALSGQTRARLREARCSVLVLPRGRAIAF